uniref:CHY-type domain-containing protein n=1 Tax=Oryza glumipatula TaxID=40148 RepID=A0A0D9Z208_9ORYZ
MGSRTRVGDARPARLLYLLRHIKTKRHRMLRDPLSPSFFSSSLNRAAPRLPKYITVGAAVRRAVRAAGAGRARARSLGQSVSLREERGGPWQAWRTTRCRPSAAAAAAAASCRGREIIGLTGGRRTQVLRATIPENSVSGSSVRGKLREMEMDLAVEQYGCVHYRRKCKIRAPCCGEIFDCRHCHNEAKDSLEVSISDRHEIPRHEIKLVICSLCNKEQDVQQDCSNCGACLGKYFCAKCNFYDDDVSKNQFHCDGCGICRQVVLNLHSCDGVMKYEPFLINLTITFYRTGGAENFFHCDKCGCCYSYVLKDSHHCVERAMHHNCPVCFEYLFDSTKDISALHCGHTIHLECLYEMRSHQQFSCPVCLRSACDMSHAWQKLDQEVAASPMPVIYQKKMSNQIWILCNDCGTTSNVQFHILGHKCPGCSSYNTRQTRAAPAAACSRV